MPSSFIRDQAMHGRLTSILPSAPRQSIVIASPPSRSRMRAGDVVALEPVDDVLPGGVDPPAGATHVLVGHRHDILAVRRPAVFLDERRGGDVPQRDAGVRERRIVSLVALDHDAAGSPHLGGGTEHFHAVGRLAEIVGRINHAPGRRGQIDGIGREGRTQRRVDNRRNPALGHLLRRRPRVLLAIQHDQHEAIGVGRLRLGDPGLSLGQAVERFGPQVQLGAEPGRRLGHLRAVHTAGRLAVIDRPGPEDAIIALPPDESRPERGPVLGSGSARADRLDARPLSSHRGAPGQQRRPGQKRRGTHEKLATAHATLIVTMQRTSSSSHGNLPRYEYVSSQSVGWVLNPRVHPIDAQVTRG